MSGPGSKTALEEKVERWYHTCPRDHRHRHHHHHHHRENESSPTRRRLDFKAEANQDNFNDAPAAQPKR